MVNPEGSVGGGEGTVVNPEGFRGGTVVNPEASVGGYSGESRGGQWGGGHSGESRGGQWG